MLDMLYDESKGLLKGYKKIKDAQNVCTYFIEKVFKKIEEEIILGKINKQDPPASILQLNEYSIVFSRVKKMGKRAGGDKLRCKKITNNK